ncbi:hypothetical protein BY996DRAFT_6562352 [Phakopsora pachyrhizi]|nr:hypothetical protein BY996DRAFT_6562352 [Phakopsora pachyrhizi]
MAGIRQKLLNYNLNLHGRVRAFSILKLSQDWRRGLGPVGKRVLNTVPPPYICQEATNWTVEDYLEQIEIGDRRYHSNKEPRADKQDPGMTMSGHITAAKEPQANAMIKENGGETKLPHWHMRNVLPNDCGCKIQVGGNRRPAMPDVHKRTGERQDKIWSDSPKRPSKQTKEKNQPSGGIRGPLTGNDASRQQEVAGVDLTIEEGRPLLTELWTKD